MIYFQRQILSNCKQYMQPDDYTDALGFLALALDEDGQYNEELGVANRCLTYNANALSCISTKVDALVSLGRVSEAKAIIATASPSSTPGNDRLEV